VQARRGVQVSVETMRRWLHELNRTTGDWHRGALTDTSVVAIHID
jgi:hypothetical protein